MILQLIILYITCNFYPKYNATDTVDVEKKLFCYLLSKHVRHASLSRYFVSVLCFLLKVSPLHVSDIFHSIAKLSGTRERHILYTRVHAYDKCCFQTCKQYLLRNIPQCQKTYCKSSQDKYNRLRTVYLLKLFLADYMHLLCRKVCCICIIYSYVYIAIDNSSK